MISAGTVFEERILYALEQAAVAQLPPGWVTLNPEGANLRSAARIAAAVAELPTRAEMAERLRDIACEVEANREGRPGEQALWTELGQALDRLAHRPEGAASDLASLSLWADWSPWNGPESPFLLLRRSFSGLLPTAKAAGDEFLDRVARLLLRALARRWATRARDVERASQGPERARSGRS